MEFQEKVSIVKSQALNPDDTAEWWLKYGRHKSRASNRGMGTELSFEDYLRKATEAELTHPSQIGKCTDQYNLGRIGDVGPYTNKMCRFITVRQNHREMRENGRVNQVGLTKETSERYRKVSEAKKGRTKENDPIVLAHADKISKNFVLTAPDGTVHRGRNLFDFCKAHGLTQSAMSMALTGSRSHHKGWTGYYE